MIRSTTCKQSKDRIKLIKRQNKTNQKTELRQSKDGIKALRLRYKNSAESLQRCLYY